MADIEQVANKVEEAAEIADAALKGAAGGIRDHNQFRSSGVVNGVVNSVVNGVVLGRSEDTHAQGVVLEHSDQRENR
jgi:hypothetical protein